MTKYDDTDVPVANMDKTEQTRSNKRWQHCMGAIEKVR